MRKADFESRLPTKLVATVAIGAGLFAAAGSGPCRAGQPKSSRRRNPRTLAGRIRSGACRSANGRTPLSRSHPPVARRNRAVSSLGARLVETLRSRQGASNNFVWPQSNRGGFTRQAGNRSSASRPPTPNTTTC